MKKDWKLTTIGNVVDFFDSKRVPLSGTIRKVRRGGYPYYGASGIIDHIDDYIFDGRYLLVAEDGENLNSRKTPIAFFAKGKFWVNNHAHIIRGKTSKVDDYFLLSWFAQANISGYITGAAQPKLSQANLKRIELFLPPIQTQHKIAAILSAYDDLIENNLRRIKILEEMAQNLYREWFVKFRFPGYEKVKFVDSPLGMIPEGWEVTTLGDYCCLTMGQSPKSEYYNDVGNGLPFHQGVSDFGHWHPSDRLYCSVDNRIAEANDILFSVRAPVGRMNFANKKIIIGRGLSAIRAKNNAQSFLWEQLRHQFTKVDMIGNGAIFASVTKNDMQRISILSPPDSVVEIVNQYLAPLHNQISCLVRRNDSIRTQRDHLLPKLVSGEVDVSDLNIKVSEEVFE